MHLSKRTSEDRFRVVEDMHEPWFIYENLFDIGKQLFIELELSLTDFILPVVADNLRTEIFLHDFADILDDDIKCLATKIFLRTSGTNPSLKEVVKH
jgi:hypothetical protein